MHRLQQALHRDVAFGQAGQIDLFAVRLMVFPATVEDAHPFERQRTNSRVVFLPAPAQLIVIGLGPATMRQRASGPFVERLALKLRTSP